MATRFSFPLWVVLCSLITFIFAAPRLWRTETNIVTDTYRLGTERFVKKENPYALPLIGGDRYEYSPFFCYLYYPFSILSPKAQALSWALFNTVLFWLGALIWLPAFFIRRGLFYLSLILASMELNISLLYQQINAGLIGLTLLGIYFLKEKKEWVAGILLCLATNLKAVPGFFAVPLFLTLRSKYFWSIAVTSMVLLLSPALWLGFQKNYLFHLQWLERLFDGLELVRPDQIDLAMVLSRLGWPALGTFFKWVVLAVTVGNLLWGAYRKKIDYEWLGLGLLGLLLISPRTESPTFVFMAPVYIYAFLEIENFPKRTRALSLIGLLVCAFFITFCFTDLWPKAIWRPTYVTKTLGAFMLWGIILCFKLKAIFSPVGINPKPLNSSSLA